MKTFITTIVLVIVGIILILGFISPTEYHVEKSLVINRPSKVVFESVKLLKSHAQWSPWTRIDPNIKYEYAGVDGTVGFTAHWKGIQEVGEGEQKIKSIIEGKRIDYEIHSKNPIASINHSYIITKEMYDNQTQVILGMSVRTSFPSNILSYMLNMPKKTGYNFDEGLRILKAILEKELEEAKGRPLEELKNQIQTELKDAKKTK